MKRNEEIFIDADAAAAGFALTGGDPDTEAARALITSATAWGDTIEDKCARAFVLGMSYERVVNSQLEDRGML